MKVAFILNAYIKKVFSLNLQEISVFCWLKFSYKIKISYWSCLYWTVLQINKQIKNLLFNTVFKINTKFEANKIIKRIQKLLIKNCEIRKLWLILFILNNKLIFITTFEDFYLN